MCVDYKIGISLVITPALRRGKDNLQGDPPIPDTLLDGCRGRRVVHLEIGPEAMWPLHFSMYPLEFFYPIVLIYDVVTRLYQIVR